MDMAAYVGEVEYATTETLGSFWREQILFDELAARVAARTAAARVGYAQAEAIWADAETPDDVMQGAATNMETYFSADRDRVLSGAERDRAQDLLDLRAFSRSALAGTVLQYAKQGLSFAHKGPGPVPGRLVGTLPLRDLVWEGRNQSEHWEEGRPRPAGIAVFETLAAEQDAVFSEFRQRSMAAEVVALLGWRDYAAFSADLLSLA